MCIKLHPALHIYIPQTCPSVARILESPIIPFTNRLSVVPSILNLSDTDFRVFIAEKSFGSSQKSKKSKCVIQCQIESPLD